MRLDLVTLVSPKPQKGFIETPYIADLTQRSLTYINAGYPVHLSGPTGCGKTTLAMHIANKLDQPVVLINGDEEFGTSSLVGSESGYRKKRVVDRFVSRVYKMEESMSKTWVDDRLTTACRYGFTLIYNEFTRSRPEANNAMLSVLEERVLDLPTGAYGEGYIKVHPNFCAIFTSNPEEYAGVFRSQDALMDRMITIGLSHYDEETEIAITKAKSGISDEWAKKIVSLVRRLRNSGNCEFTPTIRSSIMIASTMAAANSIAGDGFFKQICYDVLSPRIGKGKRGDLDPGIVLEDLITQEGLG